MGISNKNPTGKNWSTLKNTQKNENFNVTKTNIYKNFH